MKNFVIGTAFGIMALLPSGARADDKDPVKVKFTKEEADFIAYLADQDGQFAVMKSMIVVAAGERWPDDKAGRVEFLLKKVIEASFKAPGVDDALKGLGQIKCAQTSQDIQAFMMGKHTVVKGKPSAANQKVFEKMAQCYSEKK